MHGLIGRLADDPVRFAVAVLALAAVVLICRCLSGLAFFDRGESSAPGSAKRPRISRAGPRGGTASR